MVPVIDAARLIDGHAPAGGVAGGVGEEAEDGLGVLGDDGIDGGEEREENVFARELAAGVQAQGGGFAREIGGKVGVIDVDADAGDGLAVDELHQNAGDLAVVEHEVVGPAQVALDAGGLRDGLHGGDAEREREDGDGGQDDRAVDSVAGFGVPGVAVAALAGELAIGEHDGAGLACGGDAHGGIEGIEVEDLAFGKGGAEAGEIHHTSSRRKLMSMARAEWVMAPEETKSAPASA